MNKKMMTIGLMLALAVHTHAQQVAEIKVDKPLRDPSICRGADGAYYLTGSVANQKGADGQPDFCNNDGVYLWKSADLKTWTPLGNVFDLKKQELSLYGPKRWLHRVQIIQDEPYRDPVFGVQAPEIHYFRDTFWLALSMHQGSALFKSESGKPEGPYTMHAWCTVRERDASLFVADSGAVWWVFGDGRVAKMKDDLTGLAERPRLMQPAPEGPDGCPLRVAEGGGFLFRSNNQYCLMGAVGGDTVVAAAEKPDGPYGKRRVLIPGGGQATVFAGPDGKLLAACAGTSGPVIMGLNLTAEGK